jgi:hypothetical protein
MSCNNNCYLPIPPRAWSRVQNSCSLFDQNTYSGDALVTLPYSGRQVPASTLYLEYAMLNKGNVLQYKKNSSNLTKQQRYAQIAKGQWTNRNTTWATQSTRGYTNPNNQSLQRVNSVNITLDGQPTLAPVTCPKPVTPVYEPLPGTSSSGANPQVIPPPPPPPTVNTGTELPPAIVEPPVEPIVIQDLGNLVCGTQENVCTGEVIRQLVADNCHPTSDSDVPGPIMELCWNDGNPTWYPRQRYVMTNSGNKWPTNATLLSAIRPLPADIISVTNVENVVTLTWTFDPTCLPVNDFIIYENGIPIKIVSGNTFTTSIVVDNCATYTFYIIGSNGSVVSDPSNSVSIDIYIPLPPTITSINSTCNGGITINWENIFTVCFPINFYTIYQDNISIATVSGSTSSYTITTLPNCTTYSYYITTTFTDGSVSPPSNTVTTEFFPCAVQDLSIINLEDTCLTLTWTDPSSICSILSYKLYQVGTGEIYTVSYGGSPYSYNVTNLVSTNTYSFYVVSVGNPNTAQSNTAQSNTVSATTYSNAPTNLSVTTASCSSGTYLSWTAPNPTYLCSPVASYNIYNNLISPINTGSSNAFYTISGSTLICGSNTFYVRAVFVDTTLSLSSTSVTTSLTPCAPTIALDSVTSTTVTISWPSPSTKCQITSYNVYKNGVILQTSVSSPYTATGLTVGNTYTFNVTAVGNSIASAFSNTLTVTTDYSTPVIQPITTWCYKTSTITWTNVDTPDYYLFNQTGSPSVTNFNNGSITSYVSNNLINGTNYTFSVTAVYAGGTTQKTVTSLPYTQPATSTYFTGYNSSSDNGANTTLNFTSPGTLTYLCSTAINNVIVLVVGGGGGGGGGHADTGFSYRGGGAGGGGEINYLGNILGQTINNSLGTINITAIGAGGTAGAANSDGHDGGSTSLTFYGIVYPATFGKGGKGGSSSSNAGGAGGGSGVTEGGDGGKDQANGDPSYYYSNTGLRYGGGGGGGGIVYSGGTGGDGFGGTQGTFPSTGVGPGGNGIAYGGGGGGGGTFSSTNEYPGGAGRQGVVVFIVPN